MYYPDISACEYYREVSGSERADYLACWSVGWLDSKEAFTTGVTPREFLEKLFKLCLKPVAKTRGYHVCNLCRNPNWFVQPTAERNGVICYLGNGEIRASLAEHVYAAPTLIYHYVSEHGYKPPNEFIEAVLLT